MLHDSEDTEEIIERVATLDIGKAELVACIRVPHPDAHPKTGRNRLWSNSTLSKLLRNEAYIGRVV